MPSCSAGTVRNAQTPAPLSAVLKRSGEVRCRKHASDSRAGSKLRSCQMVPAGTVRLLSAGAADEVVADAE